MGSSVDSQVHPFSNLPLGLSVSLSSVQLNLAENSITGPFPTEIAQVTTLSLLNYSNNFITGSIPTTIGALVALVDYEVQENFLTGTIPTEIGLLTALTTLRLDNNRIGGVIPTELGALSFLGTSMLTVCSQLHRYAMRFHVNLPQSHYASIVFAFPRNA